MFSAKLRIVGGGEGNKEIELKLPATIGRSPDNEITLAQPLVSRRHCELFATHDQLFVRDLGSMNGTYVGSEKIEGDHPLNPGELLTVGTVTFRALYGELIETDASGFLADPATAVDQETVHLVESGTVVERDAARKPAPVDEGKDEEKVQADS